MYLVYRKSLAVGATVATIVGLGGTALAVTGSDAPAAKSAPSSKHEGSKLLKRLEHGQFVTRTKKGPVTHTIYRGEVTAASATSVTVKAKDGTSQTFVVAKTTKVLERAKGAKPKAATIASIAKGDTVVATGTGTTTVTAQRIVESAKK